jgi:hypothetical protein
MPRSSQPLLRDLLRVLSKRHQKLLPKSLLKNNPLIRNLRRRKLLELAGREKESLSQKQKPKRKRDRLSRSRFKFTSMQQSRKNKKTNCRIHLKMKTL